MCEIKKLFVVRSQAVAKNLAPFMPDFKVQGMSTSFVGEGFEVIIVAASPYSDGDIDHIFKNIRTRLLGKESKIIILGE